MLNVLTYLKETLPALWYSISFWYMPNGVLPVGWEKYELLMECLNYVVILPVGRPRTKNLFGPGLKALMRFITYLADQVPTSGQLSRITKRISADLNYRG